VLLFNIHNIRPPASPPSLQFNIFLLGISFLTPQPPPFVPPAPGVPLRISKYSFFSAFLIFAAGESRLSLRPFPCPFSRLIFVPSFFKHLFSPSWLRLPPFGSRIFFDAEAAVPPYGVAGTSYSFLLLSLRARFFLASFLLIPSTSPNRFHLLFFASCISAPSLPARPPSLCGF